jgi:hypothetical protein
MSRDVEIAKGTDGVRRQSQREAELARRRSAFEDANLPPRPPQRDACRQSADSRADN